MPLLVRGLAAALAVAVTGGVMLAQSAVGSPVRAADRVVERTVNAGAYLAERKDRLVEDFRILRVVIGTAFEGRARPRATTAWTTTGACWSAAAAPPAPDARPRPMRACPTAPLRTGRGVRAVRELRSMPAR